MTEPDDELQALIERYLQLDPARKAAVRKLMGRQWVGVEEAIARLARPGTGHSAAAAAPGRRAEPGPGSQGPEAGAARQAALPEGAWSRRREVQKFMAAQRAELARSRAEWARERSTRSREVAQLMAGLSKQTAVRRARANEARAARRREVEGLIASVRAELTASRARWAEEARARRQELADFMAGLPTARAAAIRGSAALSAADPRARRAGSPGSARGEG